jgi:hypothetical protein
MKKRRKEGGRGVGGVEGKKRQAGGEGKKYRGGKGEK